MFFVMMLATLGFDAGGPWGRRMREEGRVQLNRLTEMSRLPASGACWKAAVLRLHDSCDGLSSDAQASVALGLTDCFLESSGRDASGCKPGSISSPEDRVSCTASLTPEAFHAYTVFYTHAQSICFFIRGELWHEETERTIQRLADASAQVTEHMEAVSKFLDVSHEGLMSAITELRSWSLGEASWFHGLLFYVAALAVFFVLSAAPRTNGARPWLCLVLTLNLAVEYAVLARVATHFGGTMEEQSLRGKSWAVLSRKAAVAVCVTLVLAKMLLYRDFASENNRLLRELKTDTTQLLGELRRTDGIHEAAEKPRAAALAGQPRRAEGYYGGAGVEGRAPLFQERSKAEPESYGTPPRERLKSRPFIRGYSPYRKFDYRYNGDPERPQRSSTPLARVDLVDVAPLSKRDFYTPERELSVPRKLSADPRLNSTPVVVLRPLDLEDRSRRGSSVGSNVSTHSYSLRSVKQQ